jgi:hypothetical protein
VTLILAPERGIARGEPRYSFMIWSKPEIHMGIISGMMLASMMMRPLEARQFLWLR